MVQISDLKERNKQHKDDIAGLKIKYQVQENEITRLKNFKENQEKFLSANADRINRLTRKLDQFTAINKDHHQTMVKRELKESRFCSKNNLCTFNYPDHPDALQRYNMSLIIPPIDESILNKQSSSVGVYFFVQTTAAFLQKNDDTKPAVVRFDVTRINKGKAMNPSKGQFTAPRNGTYYFAFSLLKDGYSMDYVEVLMRKNAAQTIGVSASGGGLLPSVASFQAILNLDVGDKIDLYKTKGRIDFHTDHANHFTGWLIAEEDK